jgi:hypothetical protein
MGLILRGSRFTTENTEEENGKGQRGKGKAMNDPE